MSSITGVRTIEGKTREQPPAVARRPWGWSWGAGAVVAGAVLMFCYLRIAGATRVNSDGAGLVLQASDMLHGNLLLHGWWATDVSFITTELPEYMAVTKVAGIRPEVVHICAGLTYTLLVLLAAFVARGRARGPQGLVAALLAAGVMLAPQPSGPTTVLLGSPDHVGTAVPLLLLLLLLDRVPSPQSWSRWYIPVGTGVCAVVVLTLTIVGDPLAEVVGVAPLALACLLRSARIIVLRIARARRAASRTDDGRLPDTSWFAVFSSVLLAASAAAAVPLAQAVNSLITRHGGYQLGPARYHLMPWHVIVHDAPMVWQSFLVLFGADYAGVTGRGNATFAFVHLAGVAVVIVAVAFAAWRLVRPARAAWAGDLVADVLVLGVLVNVAAYFAGVQYTNIYSAHEIGPMLALGAALAGRVIGSLAAARLGRGVQARRVLLGAFAAGLACYALMLGIAVAHKQMPPRNVGLTRWLARHHLTNGLAPYWEASSVTLDSGGSITVLAVQPLPGDVRLEPKHWQSDVLLATTKGQSADFVITSPAENVHHGNVIATFGRPAGTYRYGPYTIMVWHKNLLPDLLTGPAAVT